MPNLVGIGNSQVPTNAMLGGLAYQDSVGDINIEKIKAKTLDTATDIFVYDTRKDSDGGAWRHRTQNKSWYNEGANAFRGARKEFPTVAVIVSTSSNLIIYDGDDPNLSMWMEFNGSVGWLNGATPAALSAKNGIITVGSNTTNQRLRILFFLKDYCEDWATANSGGGQRASKGNFLGRNSDSSTGRTLDSTIGIVNRTINGVAMTVLPNAPIDPATGLPVPTIAIATDGGTNTINDDGTVTQGYQTIATENVDLHPAGYMTDGISGAVNDSFSLYKIGTTARVASYGHREGLHSINTFLNEGTGECLFEGSSNEIAIAQSKGLLRIEEELSNYTSGLHNRTTSSYNTGWMPGNIKGAFLSDTDTTNASLTGRNLITNSTFANTNNWTGASNGVLTAPTGLGSYAGGTVLRITNSGGSNGRARSNSFSTTVGKQYGIRVSFTNRSSNGQYRVELRQSGHDLVPMAGTTTAGYYNFEFLSVGTGTYILELYCLAADGEWAEFDDVYVYELEQDRSQYEKGLQIFGTITKEPVASGSELVSYSGINGSNYLRQPYNSDLNFGTGDFSIIVWVRKNSFTTNHYIIDRATTAPSWSGSGRAYFIINNSGYHRYKLAGGSEQTGDQVTMPTGVFTQIGFVRRSGAMEFYMNGELVQTITGGNASASFDDGVTTQTLTVNRYGQNFSTDYTFDGMALLRIAGTAPSASQMKKIYNDEKCLFHENAKCALYGTSDNVKGLAHDDTTNILHVGTSAGRSEFQGLNRINNTTTAVTTAISASNGLVAEQ